MDGSFRISLLKSLMYDPDINKEYLKYNKIKYIIIDIVSQKFEINDTYNNILHQA